MRSRLVLAALVALTCAAMTVAGTGAAAATGAAHTVAAGTAVASTSVSASAAVSLPSGSVGLSSLKDIQTPHSRGELGAAASCPTPDDCFVAGTGGYGSELAYTTDATSAAPTWTDESLPGAPISSRQLLSCPTTDLCAIVLVSGVYVSATPTVAGSWVAQGVGALSVSCPSTSLCLATHDTSQVMVSTSPTDPASWTPETVPISARVVSCSSATACVLGGTETDEPAVFAASSAPTDSASWQVTAVSGFDPPVSLSCPSTALCVAGDYYGHVAVSSAPGSSQPEWTVDSVFANSLSAMSVSCGSDSRCVATYGSGVEATDAPTSGDPWTVVSPVGESGSFESTGTACPGGSCLWLDYQGHAHDAADPVQDAATVSDAIGVSVITALSCPTTTLCIAGDDTGKLLTSTDPTSATPWSAQRVETRQIRGVGCYGTSVCVATSGGDYVNSDPRDTVVLVSHDPTDATPTWISTTISTTGAYALSVTCPTSTICLVTDDGGETFLLHLTASTVRATPLNYYGAVGVSCVGLALCVAAENVGSGTGSEGFGAAYSFVGGQSSQVGGARITSSADLAAIACPSEGLCLATDGGADIHASFDPLEEASWSTSATPDRITALSCAPSARLCAGATDDGLLLSSDPTGGPAAWFTVPGGLAPTMVTCPGASWCLVAGGSAGQVIDTTVGSSRASDVVAVTGTQSSAYEAAGASGRFTFIPQMDDVVSPQPDEEADYPTPPAIVDLPSGSAWPGPTALLYGGSEAGHPGVTVHTNDGGWFNLVGGQCLGVGAAVVGSTLDVACEGTTHALYTAAVALPLTTRSRLSAWVDRGGVLTGAPAVADVGGRELVAVRGGAGRIYLMRPGTTGFVIEPWTCAAAPAIAGEPGNVAVLACRAVSGALQETTYAPSGRWGGLVSLGGQVVGQPGVAFVSGVATYAAEGLTRQLYTRTAATPWVPHGGGLLGGASIAATG